MARRTSRQRSIVWLDTLEETYLWYKTYYKPFTGTNEWGHILREIVDRMSYEGDSDKALEKVEFSKGGRSLRKKVEINRLFYTLTDNHIFT